MNATTLAPVAIDARIVRVDAAIVTTSLGAGLRLAHGVEIGDRDHVLVRLIDGDGTVGYGEASPLTFFTGETAESTLYAVQTYLAPLLVGHAATDIAELHRRWDRAWPGYRAAKCALDVALHDLVARRRGERLVAALGGAAHERLRMYKALGFGEPERVVAEAEALWALGLRTVKLKVGDTPDRDEANVVALRERFGDALELIVDGNAGFTAGEAARLARRLERHDIAYFEQPVPAADVDGLAFVRRQGGIPVMADEGVYTLQDAFRLIRAEAVDLLGIKQIKTGGLYPARIISELAEGLGVRCVVISPFDTEVGVAACAHLASTFALSREAHGLGTYLTTTPHPQLTAIDGELHLPTGVGLGVEPSPDPFGPLDAPVAS